MEESTRRKLLRRAVDILGKEELAIRMKSPVSVIEAWLHGMASMPDRKFVLLTDILADFKDADE